MLLLVFLVPVLIYTGTANANLIKVTTFNVGVVVLLCLWVAELIHSRQFAWVRSSIHVPLALYLGWSLISALGSDYKYASFNELGKLLSYALLYLVVISHLRSKRQINRLLLVAFCGAFVTGVYGLLQHLGVDWIEWYPKGPRILSSLGNPTFFAAYLVLMLPVALSLGLAVESAEARIGLGLLTGLLYLCLLFTYARAGWLGLLVGVMVSGSLLWGFVGLPQLRQARATSRAALLAGILILLTGVGILRSSLSFRERVVSSFQTGESSNVERIMTWQGALGIWRQHPLRGAGLGTFQIHVPRHRSAQFYTMGLAVIIDHAHNEFLEIAAETGVIGLALFLWLAVAYVVVVVRIMRAAQEDYWRYLASGLLGGLVAFMIQNLAGVTLRWVFGGMFFWLWLAVTVVAAGRSHGESGQQVTVWRWPQSKAEQWPRMGLLVAYAALVLTTVGATYLIIRPFQSEIHLKRGKRATAEEQGELAQAALTKAISLNRYSLASYYQLGHVYNSKGEFEQALATYQQLASLAPDYGRIHYNLGAIYTNLEQAERAATEYEQAVAQEDSPGNHMALAEAYGALGRDQEALAAASQAVQIAERGGEFVEEKPVDMHMRRAKLYYDQAQYEQAAQDYQQAAHLGSRNKLAHFHLGNCYRQLGKLEQARQEYKAALAIDPDDGRLHTNLGVVYFDLQQWEQAISHYQQALAHNASDSHARFNLGLAYLQSGDGAAARQALLQAAQLGGQQPVGIQAQAALEQLDAE